MKLTVLIENHAGGRFLAEHRLSYLIELNGQKVLFDTGHSDVFLKNAGLLGIDIHNEVNKVVLSHGHWGHGDGLHHLKEKTLITHPMSFIKRYRKSDKSSLGLKLSKEELESRFELITSKELYTVFPNLYFLCEVSGSNDFESKTTTFIDEHGYPTLYLMIRP